MTYYRNNGVALAAGVGAAWADARATKQWNQLLERANRRDLNAIHELQVRFLQASDSQNYEYWCQKGAEQDDVLSIFRLAEAKSWSGGIDDPSEDSVRFLKYYAEKGIPYAEFLYAHQVYNLSRNHVEALRFHRSAASSGIANSQRLIGWILRDLGHKTLMSADETGDNAWDRLQSLMDDGDFRWAPPPPWSPNDHAWVRKHAHHELTQLHKELSELEELREQARTRAGRLHKLVGQGHVIDYVNSLGAEVLDHHLKLEEWVKSRSGVRPKAPSFHLVLTGSPGTGKNEAARGIAEWLFAIGHTDSPDVIEVSRGDLVAGYVGQTAIKTQKVLNSAKNKVLFIDEAYTLKNGSSVDFGQEAIDTLLKFMEDNRGQITVIVAGYQREMKGFLRSNPGLASRFDQTIHLRNLTSDELVDVFDQFCAEEDIEYYDEVADGLQTYFKSAVGKESFGNARDVRKVFENGHRRLKARLRAGTSHDALTFDDVFGHLRERIDTSEGREELRSLLARLDELVGLERVKTEVNKFVESELAKLEDPDNSWLDRGDGVHMLLLGPPGTGKTEVARIIGKIFHLIGLVPEDSFTELSRSDLVGSGPNAAETAIAVLDSCLGGVVFIDEIYTLVDQASEFAAGTSEALEAVMKYMEDHRGELTVIGAGYADKLAKILEVNPGLESRFGLRLNFDAYNADELAEIFGRMAGARDLALAGGVLDAVRRHFAKVTRDESFGNAREVRNLLDAAERSARSRESSLVVDPEGTSITVEDLPMSARPSIGAFSQAEIDSVMTELSMLIGLDGVVEQFSRLVAFAKIAEKRRDAGLPYEPPSLHFTFDGPPGTGKTTVARLLGRLFKGLGLLASGHVIEASRSDLVAGFVGQTALKTEAVIQRALGGVLFVDEAYALVEHGTENNFAAEAVSALLIGMENHRDELSVVFAGYTHEMAQFVAMNPGLQSRIGNSIKFDGLSADALMTIADQQFNDRGYSLDADARSQLTEVLTESAVNPDFGNARGVRRLADSVILAQAVRLADSDELSAEALSTITAADVAQGDPENTPGG